MDETWGRSEPIFRYLDELAAPDEQAELDRLLATDPQVAEQLVAMARFDALLSSHFRDNKRSDELRQKLAAAEIAETGFTFPTLSTQPPVDPGPPQGSTGLGGFMWAAVGLLGTIAGGVFVMVGLMFFNGRQAVRDIVQERSKIQSQPAEMPAAILVRTHECHWTNERLLNPGDTLAVGQKMELRSGLAEIIFTSGARIILEGPAAFTATSNNTADLWSGKLTAKVPARAVGFSVITPTSQLVDLGTEFGVDVGSAGQTEVQVFRGKVQLVGISTVSAGGKVGTLARRATVQRSSASEIQDGSEKPAPIVLLANQSARVEKLQKNELPVVVRGAAVGIRFVRDMPREPSPTFIAGIQPDKSDRANLRSRAESSDFSIVVLPDPQHYASKHTAEGLAQTEWICQNVEKLQIKFVVSVGDNVDAGWDDRQYKISRSFMDKLNGVVPYGMASGNHDLLDDQKGDTSRKFVEYYGPQRFKKYPWYGGASESGFSSYQIFCGGGYKFLALELDVNARLPEVEWAKNVIAQHPTLPVILTTHQMLTSKAKISKGAVIKGPGRQTPQQIWERLVMPAPQIFLVLCGHYPGGEAYSAKQTRAAQPVHVVLQNYQEQRHGGNGWLRIFTFHPANNKIDVQTYSPTLHEYKKGPKSEFSLPLDFKKLVTRAKNTDDAPQIVPSSDAHASIRLRNFSGDSNCRLSARKSTAEIASKS
jgi:hypothetical protein